MYLWFIRKRSKGEPVSGPFLSEKALDLNYKMGGSSDFKANTGWLKNFKSRHSIRKLNVQGEMLSGDDTVAEKFKQVFLALLETEGLSLDCVYNVVETGLNWKSLPRNCIASKREKAAPDFKVGKDRMNRTRRKCYVVCSWQKPIKKVWWP